MNDMTAIGWGKENLRCYVISRRNINALWPREDKEVLDHNRKLHDQGKVTMCQGRDGSWVIQYAIPSNTQKRPPYFGQRSD